MTLAAMALLCMGNGCAEETGELLVDLRTDLLSGVEFDEVRAVVTGLDREAMHAVVPSEDYVRGARIAEFAALPAGERRIEVQLLFAGNVIAARPVRVAVSASVGVTVVISRDCRSILCDDPSADACLGGLCVPSTCTPENQAACPAMLECAMDAECDAPVAACAVPRCESGACFAVADDAMCGADELCAPDVGCVEAPLRFTSVVDLTEELGIAGMIVDDPTVTADQLELFFNVRNPGVGNIWRSRRSAIDEPWQLAEIDSDLSDLSRPETDPLISPDGLEIWFRTTDTPSVRMTATRPDRDSPFTTPVLFEDVPLPGGADPLWLSADNLRLIFGEFTLLERATRDAPFVVAPLQPQYFRDVARFSDELYLFAGETRLMTDVAVFAHEMSRETPTSSFGPPLPVRGLPEGVTADDVWVSEDGATMYYMQSSGDSSFLAVATR